MQATFITGCKVTGDTPSKQLLLHLQSGSQWASFAFGAGEVQSLIQGLAHTISHATVPELQALGDAFEPVNLEAGFHGVTPVLRYEMVGLKFTAPLDLAAARKLHQQLGEVLKHVAAGGAAGAH